MRHYRHFQRGIVLSGGDRQNLTPANDIIRNSIVTRFGVDNPAYRPGIAIFGVGMTVEGCAIGNGPHSGIMIAGNDNQIERNELYSLVQETRDAGAIYMGRDWTNRGNVFAKNYFHDIEGDRSGITLTIRSVAVRLRITCLHGSATLWLSEVDVTP